MARVTVFQEIRPGSGFKTGDFVKEVRSVKEVLGGATVVRLGGCSIPGPSPAVERMHLIHARSHYDRRREL